MAVQTKVDSAETLIPHVPVETEDGLLPRRRTSWSAAFKWLICIGQLLLIVNIGWNIYGVSRTWSDVERQSFDKAAFDELPPVTAPPVETSGAVQPVAGPAVPSMGSAYNTYLIIGSDGGGLRADVIMVIMLPVSGGSPVMVSLPRDLYLPNRCTQSYTRLNANLNGCGDDVNGPTLLTGAVEDFTGLEVEHFVLFTFEGFEEIIDAVGGMEICVENPVRMDPKHELRAGCTVASGELALSWVRSRKTLEFVDGDWRKMKDVSDLTRNQRQQDMILAMLGKASDFESPQELTDLVASVGDAFTLDDQLGVNEAISLGWELRELNAGSVRRLKIPVTDHVTDGGAQVLIPTVSFSELLEEGTALGVD